MEDGENFSSKVVPRPNQLVEPSLALVVVTKGPAVGIFDMFCQQMTMKNLLRWVEFDVAQHWSWRTAFKYYKEQLEMGEVHLLEGSESDDEDCDSADIETGPNFSSEVIPDPDHLVEPQRTFLVVTKGHKVGIFDDVPNQINMRRLLLTPGFAVSQFLSWKSAYRYYKRQYEYDEVQLITEVRRPRPSRLAWDFLEDDESDVDIITPKRRGSPSAIKEEEGEGSTGTKRKGAETRVLHKKKAKSDALEQAIEEMSRPLRTPAEAIEAINRSVTGSRGVVGGQVASTSKE